MAHMSHNLNSLKGLRRGSERRILEVYNMVVSQNKGIPI